MPNDVVLFVFLGVALIVAVVSGCVLCRNWRNCKPSEKGKMCVQLFSVAFVGFTFVITIGFDAQKSSCNRKLQLKGELFTLLEEVSYGLQQESGIRRYCYDTGGGDLPKRPPEIVKGYDRYRKNLRYLSSKMAELVPENRSQLSSWALYVKTLLELEKGTCGDSIDDRWRNFSEAHLPVMNEVNSITKHCS